MNDNAYKILAESISKFFKTPQYLILFVSDKCWMKCKHCWFNEEWKCENQFAGHLLLNGCDHPEEFFFQKYPGCP